MAPKPMTYVELGSLWGVSRDAARKRADAQGLARERGADGKTRVLFDADAALEVIPKRRTPVRSIGTPAEAASATQLASLLAEVERLTLLAATNRSDFERERDRGDALATDLLRLRERLVLTEQQLAETRIELVRAHALADAVRSSTAQPPALQLRSRPFALLQRTQGFGVGRLALSGAAAAVLLALAVTSISPGRSGTERVESPAEPVATGEAATGGGTATSDNIALADLAQGRRSADDGDGVQLALPPEPPPLSFSDMLVEAPLVALAELELPSLPEVAVIDLAGRLEEGGRAPEQAALVAQALLRAEVQVPLPPDVETPWADMASAERTGSADLAPASATDADARASFTGSWAVHARGCAADPGREGYLLTMISERGARAGDTSCTFKSSKRQGEEWTLAAVCSDAKKSWRSKVHLSLAGNRLTWKSRSGSTTYVRCEGPRLAARPDGALASRQ